MTLSLIETGRRDGGSTRARQPRPTPRCPAWRREFIANLTDQTRRSVASASSAYVAINYGTMRDGRMCIVDNKARKARNAASVAETASPSQSEVLESRSRTSSCRSRTGGVSAARRTVTARHAAIYPGQRRPAIRLAQAARLAWGSGGRGAVASQAPEAWMLRAWGGGGRSCMQFVWGGENRRAAARSALRRPGSGWRWEIRRARARRCAAERCRSRGASPAAPPPPPLRPAV